MDTARLLGLFGARDVAGGEHGQGCGFGGQAEEVSSCRHGSGVRLLRAFFRIGFYCRLTNVYIMYIRILDGYRLPLSGPALCLGFGKSND